MSRTSEIRCRPPAFRNFVFNQSWFPTEADLEDHVNGSGTRDGCDGRCGDYSRQSRLPALVFGRGRVELRTLRDTIPSLDLGIAWSVDRKLSEAETKFLSYFESEGALPIR
jgi:hypothetical protein